MPVVTDKIVFLHIPKAGGTWVHNILMNLNIGAYNIGHRHEHFPSLLSQYPRRFFEDRLCFTIVRHPIFWYQSRWAFRIKNGWQPMHPLDWNCASNSFPQFVDNMINYMPNGWCNDEYSRYIDTEPNLINFVGRCETLIDDFLYVMKKAGYNIDEQFVRNYPPANTSNSKNLAKYTKELYDRVMFTEHETIIRYYNDYNLQYEQI